MSSTTSQNSDEVLQLREVNDVGKETAVYLCSEDGNRVDITRSPKTTTIWQDILNVFLPAGYPHSVSKDYVNYQIYDSLQAFSSSIAGLLANRAVLQGIGVGDGTASPTAAMLLSVLQESMGRFATIFFAHRLGVSLEPECKRYRLAADVFNDTAMIFDTLSPAFPKYIRVPVLSLSSVFRSLCGVASGSSKATLSAHFAVGDNIGELNAKDASQETVISLLGMWAGSLVVSLITSTTATWMSLMFLLSVHLSMNYAAVRSVSMRTLNRQRANIVFSHFNETGQTLSPGQASRQERIFERDGVLRWKSSIVLGYCKIGSPLTQLLHLLGQHHPQTKSLKNLQISSKALLKVFQDEQYLLWYNPSSMQAAICLKQGAPARAQLKAWTHALLLAREIETEYSSKENTRSIDESLAEAIRRTLKIHSTRFPDFLGQLAEMGWLIDTPALETRLGQRIVTENNA